MPVDQKVRQDAIVEANVAGVGDAVTAMRARADLRPTQLYGYRGIPTPPTWPSRPCSTISEAALFHGYRGLRRS